MRDLVDKLSARPVVTAAIVLAISVALVVAVSMFHERYAEADFLNGILVEAHGLLFELAVLGILIVWSNQRGQAVRERVALHDEIETYRYWISDESQYRTVGCIRILNSMGVSVFDLRSCEHLKGANLYRADLSGSVLVGADLSGANLADVKLDGANLTGVDMTSATCLTENQLLRAELLHNARMDPDLLHAVQTKAPNLFARPTCSGTVQLDRSVGRIRIRRQ